MPKLDTAREKRATNAAYAARFPRRSRKQRRCLRAERTAAREAAWLEAHRIERAPDVPLTNAKGCKKRRGRAAAR